jgi:hypothetical protein
MLCVQCLQLEDAKMEADLNVLRSALFSQDFDYWILQSRYSRKILEVHRENCEVYKESPENVHTVTT